MSLFRRKRPQILIVCMGNVTRSPFFAAFLQRELDSLELPKSQTPEVSSCGVGAADGVQINPTIQLVATQEHHLSLASHRAQKFTDELGAKANLILTMEELHINMIIANHPQFADKCHTIRNFGYDLPQDNPDISDPTGGELEEYEAFSHIASTQAKRLRRYFKKMRFPQKVKGA